MSVTANQGVTLSPFTRRGARESGAPDGVFHGRLVVVGDATGGFVTASFTVATGVLRDTFMLLGTFTTYVSLPAFSAGDTRVIVDLFTYSGGLGNLASRAMGTLRPWPVTIANVKCIDVRENDQALIQLPHWLSMAPPQLFPAAASADPAELMRVYHEDNVNAAAYDHQVTGWYWDRETAIASSFILRAPGS